MKENKSIHTLFKLRNVCYLHIFSPVNFSLDSKTLICLVFTCLIIIIWTPRGPALALEFQPLLQLALNHFPTYANFHLWWNENLSHSIYLKMILFFATLLAKRLRVSICWKKNVTASISTLLKIEKAHVYQLVHVMKLMWKMMKPFVWAPKRDNQWLYDSP